jgi:hypothetical protein
VEEAEDGAIAADAATADDADTVEEEGKTEGVEAEGGAGSEAAPTSGEGEGAAEGGATAGAGAGLPTGPATGAYGLVRMMSRSYVECHNAHTRRYTYTYTHMLMHTRALLLSLMLTRFCVFSDPNVVPSPRSEPSPPRTLPAESTTSSTWSCPCPGSPRSTPCTPAGGPWWRTCCGRMGWNLVRPGHSANTGKWRWWARTGVCAGSPTYGFRRGCEAQGGGINKKEVCLVVKRTVVWLSTFGWGWVVKHTGTRDEGGRSVCCWARAIVLNSTSSRVPW